MALDVLGQGAGRLVATVAVLLQALHHDPVQLAAEQLAQPPRVTLALDRDGRGALSQRAEPRARAGWLLLADDPAHLVVAHLPQPLPVERRGAGQQLVEQHAQGVDVAARVHVQPAQGRLLRGHVQRRADHLGEVREQRLLGQRLAGRLGDAEIDHLHHRRAVVQRRQHVGRLDVAMDDAFLVGVLHCLAHGNEQLQPLLGGELAPITNVGDGNALDQLHHEVRPTSLRRAAVEHPGDIGVVHEGQCLALRLEPGYDVARVHARLENLQGHLAADRLRLLGHEDDAEAALADLLEQFVGADDRAGAFAKRFVRSGNRHAGAAAVNAAQRLVGVQELIDASPQLGVGVTSLVEKSGPLIGPAFQGREENRSGMVFDGSHGILTGVSPLLSSATQPGEFSHD